MSRKFAGLQNKILHNSARILNVQSLDILQGMEKTMQATACTLDNDT
jgi:hypothetical protein